MSMETTAGVSLPGASGAAQPPTRRSLGQLVAISIFWFAINFHWAALQQIVIPAQVAAILFQEAPASVADRSHWVAANSPLALALVEAPGLIIALIGNPFFGLRSDRSRSRFGRRRPYILIGSLANVVGLMLMAFGPNLFLGSRSGSVLPASLIVLMVALMITQGANNAAAAPFHALLPDLVPEDQRGLASGIMGIALFLGQIGGFIMPALCNFNNGALMNGQQTYAEFSAGIALAYMLVAVVMVVMAVLTFITVREVPLRASSLQAKAVDAHAGRDLAVTVAVVAVVSAVLLLVLGSGVGPGLNDQSLGVIQLIAVIIAGIGAARAFDFRPRRDPDFSWVVITRMLVMLGIYMVQFFMYYYFLFAAGLPQDQAKSSTTIFFVLVTVTALISTLIAGRASDRFGRKHMVYVSGAFMAVVGAAFIFAPYLVPGSLLTVAYIAAAIFGLGYGAYVSVDWALVADVLPSAETFARDMGIWNIGLTIPQVIATVVGAWFIALGTAVVSVRFGYTLLFVWFVIFCVLGTVTVRNIKGVKR